MQVEIFRKVALDKMSSPEQLDRLPAVSNTRAWLALAAVAALLVVFIGWGFGGSIPVKVGGQGIFITPPETSADLQALLYVPVGEAVKISPGKQVQVLPTGINKEEYGFIMGQVVQVSEHSLNMKDISRETGLNEWDDDLNKQGPVLEVQVKLQRNSETVSGYNWSASAGPPIKIGSHTPCNGWIVVRNVRPVDLLLQRY